jgi:putative peptidoglycan lipid II flippase
MGDTRTPLTASVVRLGVRAVLGVVLAIPVVRALGLDARWGAAGLAASIGLSGWIEFALLRRWLHHRLALTKSPRFVPFMIALWGIAGLAAAAALLVKLATPVDDPITRAVAVLGTYGIVYVGISLAAGMREPAGLLAQLRVVPVSPKR